MMIIIILVMIIVQNDVAGEVYPVYKCQYFNYFTVSPISEQLIDDDGCVMCFDSLDEEFVLHKYILVNVKFRCLHRTF